MDKQERYALTIFLRAVLPLIPEIAARTALKEGFRGKRGVIQISTPTDEGPWATHFVIEDGELATKFTVHEKPDLELAFKNPQTLIAFFKGKMTALPAFKGWYKLGLLIPFMKLMLKMSALLSMEEAPKTEPEKALLTRLYFYLLSRGLSQLNKAGHPELKDWTQPSPDRVYAFKVDGYDDLGAYIRIKAGKSRAAKGLYTRSKPFLTMRFSDVDSALGILMETADLLALTASQQLRMEGAPEYGAKIGELMMLVGSLAK